MVCCGEPLPDTQTTPPPPVGGCCLRTRYTCDCVAGVSTWVLDAVATECVENSECGAGISCSDTEFVSEVIDGCVCAAPLPVLPTPTCDPHCCSSTTTTTSTTSTSTSSTSSSSTTSTSSTSTSTTTSTSTSTTTSTSTSTSTTTSTTSTSTTTGALCDPWTVASGSRTGAGSFLDNSFPGNACAGSIDIMVTGPSQGSDGIDFTILINGAFFGNTGCMTSGSFNVPTPPMMTSFEVIGAVGCAGLGTPPNWEVNGSG